MQTKLPKTFWTTEVKNAEIKLLTEICEKLIDFRNDLKGIDEALFDLCIRLGLIFERPEQIDYEDNTEIASIQRIGMTIEDLRKLQESLRNHIIELNRL